MRRIYVFMVYLNGQSVDKTKPAWRRMTGWLVTNELEKMWKEAVAVQFEGPSRQLPGDTLENCINIQTRQGLNLGNTENEAGILSKSTLCWDITPCSPLKVNRRFGGIYRLHLQGRSISRLRNQRETRLAFNGLYDVISRKTLLFLYLLLLSISKTPASSQPTLWLSSYTC
jgi:hypothetical protein